MTTLCHINDIPNQTAKSFDIDNSSLFVVKASGQIYVYKNSCPHLGVELNWQENQFLDHEGSLIQCHTHGALFLIESGKCVAGPCLGQHLQHIPFQIKNQMIHI